MTRAPNVAIVGVTGAVGQELLKVIERRGFKFNNLKLLASGRSAGKTMTFQGQSVTVEELGEDSFRDMDIALFSAGGAQSKKFAPAAVKANCVVIDNSSAFRMDPKVPLVVPEVNPEAVKDHNGIIANPNCSTILMNVAVYPLHKAVGVTRCVISTYQAASGAGAEAMRELEQQVQNGLFMVSFALFMLSTFESALTFSISACWAAGPGARLDRGEAFNEKDLERRLHVEFVQPQLEDGCTFGL